MAYQDLVRRLKFLRDSYSRHGAPHILEVFRQGRIRSRYAAAPPQPVAPDEFMQRFEWYRDEPSFLEDFFRSASNRLPLSRANRKDFFTQLLLSLESYDDILTNAELISEGKFPALGICINQQDGIFDWHRDYSSGKVWPPVPFNAITFMEGDGSDVKYPWELSRMYWIAWLGKAYWITSNPAWCRDFIRLIDAWRNDNPFNVGVNWSMPMEVAIRGFWLVMGYGLFYGAMGIEQKWWVDYLRMTWDHGVYLEKNLEYFFNLTNHYISNCFGLIALGSLFSGSLEGKRWLHDGRQRMIVELEHQVLPDGVHYERSIGYHRLVLEMYLIALVLCERAGSPFPPDVRKTIEQMAEFMRDYIPPTGTVPQFGDSDDGMIMRLRHNQELYDHRDTLALAAAIFRREDFYKVAGGYSQSALLIAGSEGFELLRTRENPKPEQSAWQPGHSSIYRDGGFAILCNGHFHVVADVGAIGLHGNNDTLSFTLSTPGGAFIVDPGTYCYTRDREVRNQLRSSSAHNAPMIDGKEIAEFDGLWRVKSDPTATRIIEWSASDQNGPVMLEAEHHAYQRLTKGPITVRRRWELDGERLRIRDSFSGSGTHSVSVRIVVPGDCDVRRINDRSVQISHSSGEMMILECSEHLSVAEGWYSPCYGVAVSAITIIHEGTCTVPAAIDYICRLISSP